MKKKRSKLISMLLTLVMTLSLVPAMGVTASAATTGDGTKGSPFVVTTYDDLKEKMELTDDKYIQLGANIDASGMNGGYGLGSADGVRVYGNIHLDLNGKKLTLKKSQLEEGGEICFIRVITGSLTIEDSGNGGEIVGVNKVTKRYMQLIEVQDGTKLTLNSGKLHLEINADTSTPNATIRFGGTVEINGGTVSISKMGEWDEPTAYIYRQNFALEAIEESDNCCALINGGTFDGRVLLAAKASGVAGNVITGGDFKKSIYIRKDKAVTGDVPLNISIQGGTYHYTPGYRINPENHPYYPGKKNSEPYALFQFATMGFRDGGVYYDDVVYDAFKGGSLYEPDKYDMDAFASMFPKNVIITAEGQEYDFYDDRDAEPQHISVNDAAFTGSSSALDLARLLNSHYKTVTVTTLPSDALKDMKLTVGSDGAELPAKGTSTVSGDVALGSDGTLTKTVYITARGNKQLKEMYYSNPSKIDFGYRLNIFKNGTPVTDYTGDSLTYTASGDEISVSVQLRDFKFEEGVYTFRLALWPYLRGSKAQIGENLIGLWKLTAKEEPPAPVAHSIKVVNTFGTAEPETAMLGQTVTVTADDRTADNMMFTQWYTETAGVTFVDATKRETTFIMPDSDVRVSPGYHGVSFTNQPTDSWLSSVDDSKVYFAFSQPITSWKLVNEDDTTLASGDAESANALVAATLGPKSNKTEMTCRVIVTSNGQNFTSNEFTLKWYDVPGAPDVTVYPEGGKFVETLDVNLKTPNTYWGILYTTDGSDPYDKSGENWTKNPKAIEENESTRVTINKDTTIKACLYNSEGYSNMEKFGDIVTCDFTKVGLTPPVADPPSGTSFYDRLNVSLSTDIVNAKIMLSYNNGDVDDLSDPNWWKEYEPEKESITLSGSYGMHGFDALTGIRMEHVDGYTYWVHSDKQDYSYPRITYATIADASVTGKVNEEITPVDVSITLSGDVFAEDLTADADVSDWFNLPVGLTAKVKERTNYTKTLVITISGTPTATSTAAISVKMPKSALRYTGTSDAVEQTVLSNPKAVYNIGTSEVHTHDTDSQTWAPLNDNEHFRNCTKGDDPQFEDHKFNSWTPDTADGSKHFRECSVCGHKVVASHVESSKITDTPAGIGKMGAWHTKCVDCGKKMNTGTFPALTAISAVNVNVTVPVKGAAPGTATTMDTTYDVAATDWEPIVSGGTFAGGTKYTVKVSLEARDNNRFTNATTFQINGQTVKPVDTIPATGLDNTIITLTFPATEGGSTGGSSGGGGGGGVTKYAVAVSPADNGKVTPDKTSAAKGSVVTITAMANDGYALDTIKATDKAGKEIKLTDKGDGKYTFTMPASKVEVKAAFKQTASKPGKPAEEMKTVVVMQVGSKTMFVNGKAYEKDAAPVIMNDRTLVPIRFVTESLGGTVAWNAETKEVTLVIDGKEIKMTIGKTIEKYGVAPVIIDSRTFVPVRFVADELGATTAWNAETKTVTITKAVTPMKTEK